MSLATKKGVGFTAGVTTRSDWAGNILVFPHVVTNNGNGYNPSTGKFTAPTDGTYVFFLTVVSNSNKFIYMNIVHNGADKVRTIGHESAQYMTGTNMAVLQLVKGDSVWVSRRHGKGYFSESAPYTTFSGFLL
uniref:Caprin-2 n=1 Tax=Magallana gigas TaxID=29159 RepID=K1Q625_MAGGI